MENTELSREELERLLDPARLTRGGLYSWSPLARKIRPLSDPETSTIDQHAGGSVYQNLTLRESG